MNEAEIVNKLKDNVPVPEEPTPPPVAPPDTTSGQAKQATTIDLDELTQYKLHDLFEQEYRANDETTRQQLSYIYNEIASTLTEPEYGLVAAKIRDLQRTIGIAYSDNRIYRLYQWLKLNNVRKGVEGEMWSLTGD